MNNPSFSIALVARNEVPSLPVLFSSLKKYLKRGGEVVIVDIESSHRGQKERPYMIGMALDLLNDDHHPR